MTTANLNRLKNFFSREALLAGAISGVLVLLNALLLPGRPTVGELLLWPILAGLAGAGVLDLRTRYMRALTQRSMEGNDIIWDVEVNGVKVGQVSDLDYAAFRVKIFRDPQTYVAQLLQVANAVYRAINSLLYGIPPLVFWVVVISEVIAPGTFNSVLSAFQKASPAEIHNALVSGVGPLEMIILLYVVISASLGSRFGFINCFVAETAYELRKYCGVAAEGNVRMVRWTDGMPHFNDEMAYIAEKTRKG